METQTDQYDLKKIRALLTEGFTDEELTNFCFDVRAFRPVYDQLADSMGKAKIVQILLEYAEQKELLESLLREVKELNPAKYKKYEPYLLHSSFPMMDDSTAGESWEPSLPSQLDPDGLEAYFTDVEHLRGLFKTLVAAPTLSKRLLVIHGVGGIGKSSLLRMFRLHCKQASVPVALASGDEAKSAVEVLTAWASDLKVDGLKLSTFAKTAEHYRVIQAKVETEVHKARDFRHNAAGALGKAAAKTIIETAVSAIPVVGPLMSGLSGVGAEALVDWLSGFLKKPDIDLLLDPTKALTADLLTDLDHIASRRRLVLTLDTFEQLSTLEDWTREFTQRLHPNVLFVVAGRAVPNWSKPWPGWLAQAEVQELKPMTDAIMRELISRYYSTMHGGKPEPVQVEAIIAFARGLPIVVTSAVRLWVQYGIEDFKTVKPQVIADLVDRLQEGVPSRLVPILEAAAVVRWFNKEILRLLTGQTDVSAAFDELRRFPFTRPRIEGLALHAAVREIIDDNLRIQDPSRHRTLHEQAEAYFEARLTQTYGEEAEQLGLERLYHQVRADEKKGIELFQATAQGLIRYQLTNRLQRLLNDLNSWPLEYRNSQLWRKYYSTRLMQLEANHLPNVEQVYKEISEDKDAEPRLKAYALHELSKLWVSRERVKETSTEIKKMLSKALNLVAHKVDLKLVHIYGTLAILYFREGNWNEGEALLKKRLQYYEQIEDNIGIISSQQSLFDMHGWMGNWQEALKCRHRNMELISTSHVPEFLSALVNLRPWALVWSGRWAEAQIGLRDAVETFKNIDHVFNTQVGLRDTAFLWGLQNSFQQSNEIFGEVLSYFGGADTSGDKGHVLGFWGVILSKQGGLDKAEEYLTHSLQIKLQIEDSLGIPELFNWLGTLSELRQNWSQARTYYKQSLESHRIGRRYFECNALVGLIRVKHAQADLTSTSSLLTEAEQLAQQYEYNDHLASLRLTQAHIAWDGNLPEWGSGFEAALHYYQHALIYALRFNRFLLDEVLWGGGVCTPLRPIIPHCQKCDDEGRRMLSALRDWWLTGANDIGAARPDTISPIPEGISLIEAERLARQREPGDGLPQPTVLAKIEAA